MNKYKETIATTLLKRRNFKRFGLNRKGKDTSKNKLFEFYKNIIKDKNITLNGKILKLKDILIADYNTINLIINENKKTTFSKIEKELANKYYKDFRNKWAYILLKQLNISVCPYCNRNYIVNFSKDKTTAQLDHFFDKSTYPYLAISIYNLIPCCGTCNQRKSSKKVNIFYPYLESFNDSAKFSYLGIKTKDKLEKESIDFFNPNRIKFEIKAINNKEKVDENIEVFNLQNLYEEHKDIISELLQKSIIYNDSYIDELANNYSGLFKNREDLLRLITYGYVSDEDLNKRPLSKLIKDISEELELI